MCLHKSGWDSGQKEMTPPPNVHVPPFGQPPSPVTWHCRPPQAATAWAAQTGREWLGRWPPWPQQPSARVGALGLALQARVRKFGPKLLQLLAEWTETFPRDFEEESAIGPMKDVVGRIAPCDEVGEPGVRHPTRALSPRPEPASRPSSGPWSPSCSLTRAAAPAAHQALQGWRRKQASTPGLPLIRRPALLSSLPADAR